MYVLTLSLSSTAIMIILVIMTFQTVFSCELNSQYDITQKAICIVTNTSSVTTIVIIMVIMVSIMIIIMISVMVIVVNIMIIVVTIMIIVVTIMIIMVILYNL